MKSVEAKEEHFGDWGFWEVMIWCPYCPGVVAGERRPSGSA